MPKLETGEQWNTGHECGWNWERGTWASELGSQLRNLACAEPNEQ